MAAPSDADVGPSRLHITVASLLPDIQSAQLKPSRCTLSRIRVLKSLSSNINVGSQRPEVSINATALSPQGCRHVDDDIGRSLLLLSSVHTLVSEQLNRERLVFGLPMEAWSHTVSQEASIANRSRTSNLHSDENKERRS